jgi:hypothetical protein
MGAAKTKEPKPLPIYLTAVERADFLRRRKNGSMSWFRTKPCEHCGEETHRERRFCKKACAVAAGVIKIDVKEEPEDDW